MDSAFEARLIDCLDALEAGESIESILARYPDDAPRLRPSLELAAALPTMRWEPSEIAEVRARRRFLAQADSRRRAAPPRSSRWPGSLAAVAAVVLAVGVGLAVLSGTALPGGPLYGLKRSVEEVRLSLAPNVSAREAIDRRIKQTRRDEVMALLSAPRDLDIAVVFEGVVEAMEPRQWLVSGIPLTIDSSTQIDGSPAVGDEVQVNARLTAGILHVGSIQLLSESRPAPPSQTLTSTPIPQPEETLLEPTASPPDTPTPTIEPSPIPPTLVPLVPSQDANDNGDDDNANDNGDDDNANDDDGGGDDNGGEVENDNSGESEGEEDNSGPGGGEDGGDNSGSGSEEDNSGSGSSSDDDSDDHSGSGGGSDDSSDDNSGSDEEPDD
jgi:hypothetical protein